MRYINTELQQKNKIIEWQKLTIKKRDEQIEEMQNLLNSQDKIISEIRDKVSSFDNVIQPCDHEWINGRVTCGTEVCIKCNEARLKEQ